MYQEHRTIMNVHKPNTKTPQNTWRKISQNQKKYIIQQLQLIIEMFHCQ